MMMMIVPKYRNDETVEACAATNIMMGSSFAEEVSSGGEVDGLFKNNNFELDSTDC